MTSSARSTRSTGTAARRPRPRLVAAAVASVALSVSLPATAMAGTADGTSVHLATGATTATLVLQAPDAQLGALAAASGVTRSDRRARLAASVPSSATRSAAVASAAALGLTVTSSSAWSVVVHGKAADIARLARSGRVAGASLSEAPSLVPAASSVVLGGGQQLDWRPADVQQPHYGADFRAAYSASSASPPVGASRPVIATLQFAGWTNPGELAIEAANLQLPTPGPSVYTAISVDGALVNADDGSGGSGEVALDQESIYATNPYADQRAYIAGSTVQNEIDAYNQIATDALSSRGIMALSISWTVCEHDVNNLTLKPDEVNAVHAAPRQGRGRRGDRLFRVRRRRGQVQRRATGRQLPRVGPAGRRRRRHHVDDAGAGRDRVGRGRHQLPGRSQRLQRLRRRAVGPVPASRLPGGGRTRCRRAWRCRTSPPTVTRRPASWSTTTTD